MTRSSGSTPSSASGEAQDPDLDTIAAIDSTQTGVMATLGSGWVLRTYAQIKTALGLTASDVGLGSVNNTADTAKPVSTAQQTALDGKVDKTTLSTANSVMVATSANTPTQVAMGASTILARLASGNIVAASVAQIISLLGLPAGGSTLNPYLSDGADGAYVFDGTNTFSNQSTKSGNVYTLIAGLNATTISISAGVTVKTAGNIMLATTSITNNGTIANDGADATNTTGAAAGTPGAGGGGGGTGGTPATGIGGAGSNTGSNSADFGGKGGNGGAGSSAAGSGGTLSTAIALVRLVAFRATGWAITPTAGNPQKLFGGTGGGAGGGDGTNKGGPGGGAGGTIVINTPSVVNNGAIHARGGAGGTQATAAINCGGGGGGGGGVVCINTTSAVTGSGTIDANGGSGAASNGTGAAGSNGNNGTVYQTVWA